MFAKNSILSILIGSAILYAGAFEEFRVTEQKEPRNISAYKSENDTAFKQYLSSIDSTYKSYQKELLRYWEEPRLTSTKQWVSYTPDMKTRSTVDFSTNEIVIETVASNPKIAHNNVRTALRRIVTIDTRHAYENDPLQKRIIKIKKPRNALSQPLKSEPILSTVLFDETPTTKRVDNYVLQTLQTYKTMVTPSQKNVQDQFYSLRIPLPKNTQYKRSVIYQKSIAEFSHRFELTAALIFAVIHTESAYNPFARSPFEAYGLMQVFPGSASVDTYEFLYKKKRLPSPQYLYESRKNIEMGSGHLHLLYYQHLKSIKDPTSRLYCTIAAYNTGVENLAYAFGRTYNIKNAVAQINTMQSNDVYKHLQKHLRHDKSKLYLQNVVSRMAAYHKLYGEKGNRKQELVKGKGEKQGVASPQ